MFLALYRTSSPASVPGLFSMSSRPFLSPFFAFFAAFIHQIRILSLLIHRDYRQDITLHVIMISARI